MTVWITPQPEVADRLGLPAAAIPLSQETAETATATGRLHPGAAALDIDAWLRANEPDEAQRQVLGAYVGVLAYLAAAELSRRDRPDLAADVLDIGLDHLPEDPAMRARLGIARWEAGHRYEGTAHLVSAVNEFGRAGRTAPLLSIIAARALADASRFDAALEVLRPLGQTETPLPHLEDLVSVIDVRRREALLGTDG